jgi:uncharacterized membrane protein YebE (DUF533 family)
MTLSRALAYLVSVGIGILVAILVARKLGRSSQQVTIIAAGVAIGVLAVAVLILVITR